MMNFNLKNMLVNLNFIHVIPHELHIFMQYTGGKFDIAHACRCRHGDGHVVYYIYLKVNEIEKSRKNLMLFLCVYVFYIGFNRAISQFMGFFQHVIMCM